MHATKSCEWQHLCDWLCTWNRGRFRNVTVRARHFFLRNCTVLQSFQPNPVSILGVRNEMWKCALLSTVSVQSLAFSLLCENAAFVQYTAYSSSRMLYALKHVSFTLHRFVQRNRK
jgi:hypothetical protein